MRSVFLFFLTLAIGAGQEAINYASISGRVTDEVGAVVQGAQVSLRQTETNQSSAAVTDSEGRFRFAYLRVGPYELLVNRPGFAVGRRSVTLTVGAALELAIPLRVASHSTEITVSAETETLEAARSQIAGTISQSEVRNLPLNGRNFLDLALLVPGVSPTNTGSTQLFAETSAAPGQGISVGSQRNFSNSFIVDGLSANDDAAGLAGVFYGADVVQEFQVVTSGGQAELGRALGGYVNMITRSGTNSVHGDVYGYFHNQRLNAANPLSHTKLPSTETQYGASLGGPVTRDRTFYFANFEQRLLNQSGLITIAPASVDAINARLDAVGYPGARIATGLYPDPVHNTNFLGKVDRKTFSLRYSLYHVESSNSRGAGALNAATAAAGLDDTDQSIAFGNVATLSPHTVNETRGQYARSSLQALPVDPVGPAVTISGVATFGTLSGSPTGRFNNLYELTDNISHQAGGHALKAGVDWLYNDLAIDFPRSIRGAYTFSSLATFLQGVYNNAGFAQTFGSTAVSQRNPNVGFYAQDEWKVSPRLVVNLGLRYDLQYLKTISTDTNNLSPRAGFAWTPFAARRTVVRGSFGLFYDRVPLRALANALLSSGNSTTLTGASQVSVSLSPAQSGAPMFPNILAASALPAGVLANFSTMNRHIQNGYSEQGSVEVEQQLGPHSTLSVGYEHLRGLHLILSLNQNVPSCAAAGTNNGCRPDPNYANNSQYSSAGDSRYDGLHITYLQKPVRWGSYRISYAWSKALDNEGEFFFSSPIDNFNIWKDYGRSDDDQRHRLSFDGTVQARGFQLSGILQYDSALPLNITSGATTIQGTAARPLVNGEFIGRNTGIGNDAFTVNARLSRGFRVAEHVTLEAMGEVFNALNHRNNVTKNGVFGTGLYPSNPAPGFGNVTAVGDSRVMQVALRLKF
ncbi:MAG TPA: TonB-dependent receptor [Candidatus Sulfopaludibacter sp.]|nr:TonB-dependent receptor [Candidatus Sulfopaludibacter sp.]